MGTIELSTADCESLHTWGSTLCLCSTNTSNATAWSSNNCSLCEDGGSLPKPVYEGLPSTTCAQLQVNAIRDDPSLCTTWQKTVGVYCQCNNTLVARNACRLCGQFPLPDPLLQGNSTNFTSSSTEIARSSSSSDSNSSCGELEFQANLPDSNCSDFQQRFGSACCQNLVFPTAVPRSGASLQQLQEPLRLVLLAIWLAPSLVVCFQ